ncbi:pyruvate dehydrogenase complex dihydrolipoamide acetyltransferase [Glutamicibacter endophyticus]
MPQVMRMPEVLTGMTEAALQTWLVATGDTVAAGTAIAEVETEKAMVEISAEIDGVVEMLLVAEGDTAEVGEPILQWTAKAGAGQNLPEAIPAGSVARNEAGAQPDNQRIFASPIVRRLARRSGTDLRNLRGTGDGGRIVRRDLEAYLAARAVDLPVVEEPTVAKTETQVVTSEGSRIVPLTGMRRAIARRLTESKTTVPHFYLSSNCDVGRLLELRREVNETRTSRVSVNDFVVLAAARALIAVPEANVIWGGEHLVAFDSADVAVAVATDGGLLTPVVRGAEGLGVGGLSARIGDLASRARTGRLRQEELEGGSFTVSNLGMYGVDQFSAILNPPQSGILAVGTIEDRVVAVDGQAQVRPMMSVTVSWDHRAVDGAVGAQWLRAFVENIEHPLGMLI